MRENSSADKSSMSAGTDIEMKAAIRKTAAPWLRSRVLDIFMKIP
jgi:hypothetical protein